jgi:hypothetical protein
MGKYFNHCAHVLNKSFKGFTGGKDIRKENFPKSEKSGGASLNKVARQLYMAQQLYLLNVSKPFLRPLIP